MNMRNACYRVGLVAWSVAMGPSVVVGQELRIGDRDAFLMEAQEETELGRSAGPSTVGAGATIMVMTSEGDYVVSERGENGWVCAVGRAWTAPAAIRDGRRVWEPRHLDSESRAPMCYNPPASRTVLRYHEFMSQLFMQGQSAQAVEDSVQQALEEGRLQEPEPGSMVYMLSPRQNLNRRVGRWMPHFMFYTPYADAKALYGTEGLVTTQPFVTDPGSAWAVTTTVATHWSDGTLAPSAR